MIALAAIAVSAIVLVFFAVDTLRNDPATFVAIVAIALLAVVLDVVWKRSRPARAETAPATLVAERRAGVAGTDTRGGRGRPPLPGLGAATRMAPISASVSGP